MTNQPSISRVHLVYMLCLPLAVAVGYFWAEPLDYTGLGFLLLVLGMLAVPLLMRWHYPVLLFGWNCGMMLYFVSSSLYLWMVTAACGLFFAVLNRSTDTKRRFIHAPLISMPLLALAIVVVVTAFLTGGFGIRTLGGSTFGGRGYINLFAAMAGYFALTSRQIPRDRVNRYLALFFLPGILTVMSNIVFVLGPKYYFFYNLFPAELASNQAQVSESLDEGAVRLTGLYWASLMLGSFMLARFGLRGILEARKPWRLAIVIVVIFGCLFSGFRSNLILLILMFASMFFFEGLWRTRLMPIMAMLVILISAITLPFISSLPLSAQRTLSFLPVEVDPIVRYDAQASTGWRIEMWQIVLPEVPKYLFKGKGYALNPAELAIADDAMQHGWGTSMDMAMVAGDYHSGPLSVIIPFGIFGVIAFGWFVIASIRALYLNQKNGDPSLFTVNTFLLAYFVARIFFFVFVFGALNGELWIFTGLVGLSIALNGGVKRSKSIPETDALQLAPA